MTHEELILKAKEAKNAEELLALAKENGIEMTEESAQAYFEQLNKKGELADEELDNVSGGACTGTAGDPAFVQGDTLYWRIYNQVYKCVVVEPQLVGILFPTGWAYYVEIVERCEKGADVASWTYNVGDRFTVDYGKISKNQLHPA